MGKRILLFIGIVFVLYVWNAFSNPYPSKNATAGFRPQYGFSYSFERAGWFGLDGRASFVDLLESAHFDWVRLPFFWDTMAVKNGDSWKFTNEFNNLTFAVNEAKKHNVKVIVALGAKTPYYPEFHLPKDVASRLKFGETISDKSPIAGDLLAVDEMVVKELSGYDNIAFWQVENEPFLANVNNWKIDRSLLLAEVSTVRVADPYGRPVILNHVGPSAFDRRWHGLIPILQNVDGFGVNAYFKTQGTYLLSFDLFGRVVNIPWPHGFWWPVQSWLFLSPNYYDLRSNLAQNGHDLWVLEMQAEPYIRTLAESDLESAFGVADIGMANKYLVDSRVKYVGLWGAEFWEYKKLKGDNTWINSVKAVVR